MNHSLNTPSPSSFFRRSRRGLLAVALLGFALSESDAQTYNVTLVAPFDGDAGYAWNSKYGPYGYTAGGTDLGVGLYFGAPYGNDYTVGIVEIPIAPLQGGSLLSANLNVYSNGFGTGYFYGSAAMFWIAPSMALTGNPVTDGVGSMLSGVSNEYNLWDSSVGQGAGWFSFDVTTHVQADLDAGRSFSTFVVGGSRDTYGSIRAAEYAGNFGPQIAAVSTVPEPSSVVAILAGVALLGLMRRHRHQD